MMYSNSKRGSDENSADSTGPGTVSVAQILEVQLKSLYNILHTQHIQFAL